MLSHSFNCVSSIVIPNAKPTKGVLAHDIVKAPDYLMFVLEQAL